MARRSAQARRIKTKKIAKTGTARAKSRSSARSKAAKHPVKRGRVRVVGARPTRAKRPARPLPVPDPLSERAFSGSLERSLRDYRILWEALAKR
jgi:hypothetical protein